ncbi:MAG: tRNA guanosine(15) transglycosylase TgtA, partial [Caldisphaera sp.]|nr:tRNA guanosine(15) transglycosylase TgtA [Caldisphaera sp.]
FYNEENLWNPRIINYKTWILTKYLPDEKKVILRQIPKDTRYCMGEDGREVIYYTPYIGLIPYEICGVYPTIQFHYYDPIPIQVERDLINMVRVFIIKMKKLGYDIIVEASYNNYYSHDIGKEAERLKVKVNWK